MTEFGRKTIGVLVLVVILTISLATAWFYFSPSPQDSVGRAIIEDTTGDRITVETTQDTVWNLLEELHGNGTWAWIGGLVAQYDNSWGFQFVPDSVAIKPDTNEDSKSTIRGIGDDVEFWLNHGPVFVNSTVVLIDGVPVSIAGTNNYTIEATLHTNNNTLVGWASVDYISSSIAPLDEIVFHIYPNAFQPDGGITINSVKYLGDSLSYSIEGIDSTVLRVDLVTGPGPGPLDFEETVTIELEFQVQIPEKPDRFGWFHDESPADLLVYNLGNWYPIASVYDERGWHTAPYTFNSETFYSEVAMYDVSLTVPEDYVIAATGELENTLQELEKRTWNWKAGPVRDFAWCASPDFETESVDVDGVTVTSYHTVEHAVSGSQVLLNSEDALRVYGDLFGPYPWESLSIVETISSVSMEYPQLVMITTPSYESPSTLEKFVAHEIGHQWIPFAIGVNSFLEAWIDEGFATYSEFCYYEYVHGPETRESHRDSLLSSYWAQVFDWGDDSLNHSMDYWVVSSGYGAIAYEKAALVFDMLRHQLGNDMFYEAWQRVYLEFLHRNMDVNDLKGVFEEVAGESLDWFFDHWVYGKGVVTFSLVEATTQANGGEWTLDFQLEQSGDNLVSLWVPILIHNNGGGELIWFWVDATSQNALSVSIDFAPTRLELDPEALLLCRYGVSTIDVTPLPRR